MELNMHPSASMAGLMLMDDSSDILANINTLAQDFTTEIQTHDYMLAPSGNQVSPIEVSYSNHHDTLQSSVAQEGPMTNSPSSRQPIQEGRRSTIAPPPWKPIGASPSPPTEGDASTDKDCFCNPPCASSVSWVSPWCRRHLDKVAIGKMTDTGDFSTPSPTTIDCLLKYCFRYKHFRLPVLSEWEIYCLIHTRPAADGELVRPISLALLYAIMSYAGPMATREEAAGAGFSSIRAMTCAFYTRAKVSHSLVLTFDYH